MQRRQFLGAAATAAVAVNAPSDGNAAALKGKANAAKVRYFVGHQGHSSDEDLKVLSALGVHDICSELPSRRMDDAWTVAGLKKLRERVESFGIRLRMVPLPLSSHPIDRVEFPHIMLGKSPQRDREIADICQIIRNCAEVGIPAAKYNLSMLGVLRTASTQGRGRASYSTFAWNKLKRDQGLTIAGEVSEKTAWERITYFLERVVPVAEKFGVRLACHPHDPGIPPGERHRGLPRVLGSVEGLKKFVDTAPSKFHGLNFCQGSIAEMLKIPRDEIDDVIRYFGTRGKIFNVHFRNIQGGFLDFRETFIDDGDMDMVQALRVYREVGFDGMIMPDHVPRIEGDRGGGQAFAFTFGYIQAAIRRVASEA